MAAHSRLPCWCCRNIQLKISAQIIFVRQKFQSMIGDKANVSDSWCSIIYFQLFPAQLILSGVMYVQNVVIERVIRMIKTHRTHAVGLNSEHTCTCISVVFLLPLNASEQLLLRWFITHNSSPNRTVELPLKAVFFASLRPGLWRFPRGSSCKLRVVTNRLRELTGGGRI